MTTALRGCGTAIVTPFTHDGTVDVEALRKLVEWQIEEGIDFLVPCGSTGEAQTLSAEERELVVRTVVEAARGRVPVMAGATHNDTRQAVEEAARMSALGVTWLLSATPYYNKPTPEGLSRHFVRGRGRLAGSGLPVQRAGPHRGEHEARDRPPAREHIPISSGSRNPPAIWLRCSTSCSAAPRTSRCSRARTG